MITNRRGSAMITVLAIAFILNVTLLAFFFATRHTNKTSGARRLDVTSLNIAEAGKERLYADVRYNAYRPVKNGSATVFTDIAINKGFFTVSYRSDAGADTLWIRSAGRENTGSTTIDVIATVTPDIPISRPPLRGAVTARSRVIVQGSIIVDGRDHDTVCNVVTDGTRQDVFAISSWDTVESQTPSAYLGGKGLDPEKHKQLDPIFTTVTEAKAPPDPAFDSPESFLGLGAGALDAFKSADPSVPSDFRGVIYKTCDDVGPVDFGTSAGGILIVHNSTGDATLHLNNGDFKGLIITDKMGKINGSAVVHGAVVVLSAEPSISFWGLGNAKICYSNYVLSNLTDYCDNIKNWVNEIAWKEVK